MPVTHRFHSASDRRSLFRMGIDPRDDGTFKCGPHILVLRQVLDLIELLNAGVRIGSTLEARAFVLGLSKEEAEKLALACAERVRGGAEQGVG